MKSKHIFSLSSFLNNSACNERKKGCGDPAAVSMRSADLYASLRLKVMLNLLFLLETVIFEGLTLDCVCSGCVQKGADVSQPYKCWVTCGLRHRCYSFLGHLRQPCSVVIMWEYDPFSGWSGWSMPSCAIMYLYIAISFVSSHLVWPVSQFCTKRENSESSRGRETTALCQAGSYVSFNHNVRKYVS